MGRSTSLTVALLLLVVPASAQDSVRSPYRHQLQSGYRGLSADEVAALRAGTGMGLARAAELNGFPGPRHVLDAVAAGQLPASAEQVEQVQKIFASMQQDAQRVGADILDGEARLEAAFRSGAITEPDLRTRIARIAVLQGELRTIHLQAHLATRAVLSDAQVARYNAIRGYVGSDEADHPSRHHPQ